MKYSDLLIISYGLNKYYFEVEPKGAEGIAEFSWSSTVIYSDSRVPPIITIN